MVLFLFAVIGVVSVAYLNHTDPKSKWDGIEYNHQPVYHHDEMANAFEQALHK